MPKNLINFRRGNISKRLPSSLPSKKKYPDVKVSKISGQVKIRIDKNNIFTYSDDRLRAYVQQSFQQKFSGRPHEDETLEELEDKIRDFLKECVKRKIIMREEDLDNLYKGYVEPGGPGFYSSSYIKCFGD